MKTTLTIDVNYNENKTDPESLATALDNLMETALGTHGILEEYGDPNIGEFFVKNDNKLPTLNVTELQRLAIKEALQKHGGRVSRACLDLGIGRATLYRWLNEKKV